MGDLTVYEMKSDLGSWPLLTASNTTIRGLVEREAFRGAALSDWRAPRVWRQLGWPRSLPDLPHFVAGSLVLGPRAQRVAGPMFLQCGQLLPLRSRHGLVVFNCTVVADAIDTDATRGSKFPDSDRYITVRKLRLLADQVPNTPAFKLRGLIGKIFAGQELRAAVLQHGLTGVTFVEIPLA